MLRKIRNCRTFTVNTCHGCTDWGPTPYKVGENFYCCKRCARKMNGWWRTILPELLPTFLFFVGGWLAGRYLLGLLIG